MSLLESSNPFEIAFAWHPRVYIGFKITELYTYTLSYSFWRTLMESWIYGVDEGTSATDFRTKLILGLRIHLFLIREHAREPKRSINY